MGVTCLIVYSVLDLICFGGIYLTIKGKISMFVIYKYNHDLKYLKIHQKKIFAQKPHLFFYIIICVKKKSSITVMDISIIVIKIF